VSLRGARQPVGWRRRVTAAFTEHLALKSSALLLTVALWFAVAAREPTEEVVSVQFAPLLDSALVLRDPPVVWAHIVGRASEILKLSGNPLVIRREIASDVPDTLAVSLRTGDVIVPDGVQVIVTNVEPRTLTLRFESTVSRQIPVRSALHVRAPTGGVEPAVEVRLNPESVTVLGPRRAVARLRFVSTARDSVSIDTLPHLVDLDTIGLGVTVRPPQVKAIFSRRVAGGGGRARP
jgi:hypothetical protein